MLRCKYVHTNLITKDWKNLANFYQQVFGCKIVPPERDIRSEWLEKATGIPSASLRGAHLRLPGWGEDGPTLEIFQYDPAGVDSPRSPNRDGFGHIAFQVDDVDIARSEVLQNGGSLVGEIVQIPIAGAGEVTFVYVTDPDGNILELQSWKKG